MNIDKKDLKIETMRGKGPGGQHRNKTSSTVRMTHIPTGIQVIVDGRKQGQNKKKAMYLLQQRLEEHRLQQVADTKKAYRDKKIKESSTIRTYDYKRQIVKDHRTGKQASLKEVLKNGNIDLLR